MAGSPRGTGGGRTVPKKKCNVMVRVCPPHPPWSPIGARTGLCGSLEPQARWAGRRTGEARHRRYLGPKCPPHCSELETLGLAGAGSRPQLQLPACSRQEISWQKAGAGTEGSWRLTGGGTQRKEKRRGGGGECMQMAVCTTLPLMKEGVAAGERGRSPSRRVPG